MHPYILWQQIGLYAQLFNELVQGMVTKDMIASQLSLKMDVPLSDGIQKHIQNLDMNAEAGAYTLGHILSTVLCQVSLSRLKTQPDVAFFWFRQ